PSGHAIMAINVFGFLWYVCAMSLTNNILQVGVGVMFFAIILLVGFSRIYLKVHYSSDVIAGYLVGWAWLILMIRLLHDLSILHY
ncbi:MAG: phosphatase PAP2 family protein, partial [Ferruginibacter sp.]